jgi:hypothetical protein
MGCRLTPAAPRRAPRASLVIVSLALLLSGHQIVAREVSEPWGWSDGADGTMGLVNRGLYAVERFDLEHHLVTYKVHYNILPAIDHLRRVAVLLPAAALKLRSPATASSGKADAAVAVKEHLAVLVKARSFDTRVQGGRPAVATARWAGRKVNPSKARPTVLPPRHNTMCGKGVEADGGAVPLLERELDELDDPAEEPGGAADLADVLDCIAKQATQHADAMAGHRFGSSGSISLHTDGYLGLMRAYVANMQHHHREQDSAHWPWNDENELARNSFNAETAVLLDRIRVVEATFVHALQLTTTTDAGDVDAVASHALQAAAGREEVGKILTCRFTDANCGGSLSRSSWFKAGSDAQAAWNRADGFGTLKHSCAFSGDEVVCSMWPDPLHQYLLRLFATFFSRLLLLAQIIDKSGLYGGAHFASLKEAFELKGLTASDAMGAIHLTRLHGNRITTALLVLAEVAAIFPQPYRGAIADMAVVLPWLRRVTNEVDDVERQYGCGKHAAAPGRGCCEDMSERLRDAVALLDVYNGNMIPPRPIISRGKQTDRFWSWTTSPSVFIFSTHLVGLFEQRCAMSGGLAGRSAAAPEMAHKVLRKAWHAHSFLNAKIMSGGKTQYYMVARGVIVGKAVFYRSRLRTLARQRKVLR